MSVLDDYPFAGLSSDYIEGLREGVRLAEAEASRYEAECLGLHEECNDLHRSVADLEEDMVNLAAEITAGEKRIAELTAALKPFAAVAEHDIGTDEDDADIFMPMRSYNRAPRLTVGDLRKARAALSARSQGEVR